MKHSKYSAVIIGSGIAGLFAAIKLKKEVSLPYGIAVITKSQMIESNSKYAQGGVVSVMSENPLDSCTLHIDDTLKAGAGLTNREVAEFISKKSAEVIKELQDFGVDFDRDENNKLKFTKEAAHSVNRILHAGGDATGFCIENALVQYILNLSNISVFEDTLAVEILKNSNNAAKGVITYNYKNDEYQVIESPVVIIATGGIGQLYKYTTNPDITTGDGIALAYRIGAVVKDMEFVQFHPTAFALGEEGTMFLISEAVRGEGAKLVDKNGNTFMEKYDERMELAPRDIVTRAIYSELVKSGEKNVYLDARHIIEGKFKKRFPTIFSTCMEYNINPAKDLIPVSPSAHYYMGGIKTGVNGKTSIKGLYAIGEAACTGLHGANRLASNSILECLVTAHELVNLIKNTKLSSGFSNDDNISHIIDLYSADIVKLSVNTSDIHNKIKQIMWDYCGIVRSETKLNIAKSELKKIKDDLNFQYKCDGRNSYELRNMLTVAQLIVDFAIERKESRGAHYRDDYPYLFSKAYSKELKKGDNDFTRIYY